MSDPLTPPPAPARAAPRWMSLLLALSLGVNLLVFGAVGAAMLWHGARDGVTPRDRVGGPLTRALAPQDRRAIGRAIRRGSEDRATREAARRAEYARLLATLRREPFDAAAAEEAVAALLRQGQRREDIARAAMLDRLAQMGPEERRAFADRLEQALERPRPHDGSRP